MFLAIRCPVCGQNLGAPCPSCAATVKPLGPLEPPPGVDRLVAAFSYGDAARRLLTDLKYRDQRAVVTWVASRMVEQLGDLPARTCVTWAPTSPARRRQRGFDQAELLARAVARRLHLPVRRLLVRRPGPPQTGSSGVDRRVNQVRFRATRRVARPLLVVDDVLTTGTTLAAAATALRQAGARPVVAAVAAATPLGSSTPPLSGTSGSHR